MRLLVLGAGLQGSACAYDLLAHTGHDVVIADIDVSRLPDFLQPYLGKRLTAVQVDANDPAAMARVLEGVSATMSAFPYYFNRGMSEAAIAAGSHFCDLGGNTEIVLQQKAMHDRAVAAGVSVVPDCGLAPGMVNILAEHGIRQLDRVHSVRIKVGGLPQNPEPPLNYQVVYSLEGVLDYYTTLSWVLRDGRQTQVTALSEIEELDFPGTGRLEAFHTAGGLSTMAQRYEGKIPTMEYKTLRKDYRESPDLVALRVEVDGMDGDDEVLLRYDLLDRYDAETGITAMMRTTGFSLAITGAMQAEGKVPSGVHTPDEAMPAREYIAALAERGVVIQESRVVLDPVK